MANRAAVVERARARAGATKQFSACSTPRYGHSRCGGGDGSRAAAAGAAEGAELAPRRRPPFAAVPPAAPTQPAAPLGPRALTLAGRLTSSASPACSATGMRALTVLEPSDGQGLADRVAALERGLQTLSDKVQEQCQMTEQRMDNILDLIRGVANLR
eukprot:TRINITY_DN15579_c0_g1_i1.p2 TRINITY_DN15579_c0_g1~~TRINITY_DN15579_c0_g1_i1.p2  ORF type:complete len:158 (+),score=10.54 TRINITY_DN15579_c0_g1_i1:1-474(+)